MGLRAGRGAGHVEGVLDFYIHTVRIEQFGSRRGHTRTYRRNPSNAHTMRFHQVLFNGARMVLPRRSNLPQTVARNIRPARRMCEPGWKLVASIEGLIADPAARRIGYGVDLVEARLFYPVNDERPFAFVPGEFEKRKLILDRIEATGQPNVGGQVIKLGLNGLSGKVAQSIGGGETKPPGCYNVLYACAIRAGTRRSIGEAALQAPHETVQFCTDAVFSRVPLVLDEGKELGQWELEEVRGLLTVQSGVYRYLMEGGKIENKTRGFAAGSVARRRHVHRHVKAAYSKVV